ncbi:hypothetical protein [Lactobacillus hominis]|uniref:Uncharacterized protein n=1 Tax=Lactobacillus hominis DSM 23910 = CRBIP 24.179 TaxID=1423758 RepID=I7IVK9_9LACO|nr:hypothetical protein [Lactobacillus hominis]KRM85835.1 hypothetical protein FC41_GL000020 [Lactobacillus hominis DSM 23910 = CRBIP 24.179]MCT3348931.1 hypothetical protein [Lactobacillus hominis]CCI81623.1 Protein of unknown function [Lactobacillus hominis DSM 23910 = CRBIP 24.179]
MKLKNIILSSVAILSMGLSALSPVVQADTYTDDEITNEFKEDRARATQKEAGELGFYPDLATDTNDHSAGNPWNSNVCRHFHFKKGVTYVDTKRGLSFKLKKEDNFGDGYIYSFIIKSIHASYIDYGENDNEDGQSFATSVSLETDESTKLKKLPEIDGDKVQAFHFENGVNYVDKKNGVSIFFIAFAGNDFDNGDTYNFTFYSKKKFVSDYEESDDVIIPPASKKDEERKESYKVVDKINTSESGVW